MDCGSLGLSRRNPTPAGCVGGSVVFQTEADAKAATSAVAVALPVTAGDRGGDEGNRTPNPALQMHGLTRGRMECAGRSDAAGGLVVCVGCRRRKLDAIVGAIASTVDPRSGP